MGPGDFAIYAPTNFGALTISGGNLTLYNVVNFNQALVVPANVYVTTVTPQAVVNISKSVTGAGVLSNSGNWLTLGGLNMSGYFNAVGGNTTIASDAAVGVLTLAGGTLHVDHKITATQLNLLLGMAQGSSHIKATNIYLKGDGFQLNTNVFLLGQTYVSGKTLITFHSNGLLWGAQTNTIQIPSGASLLLQGNPGSQGFTNDGTVVAVGSFTTQNVNVAGTGSFNVSSSLRIGSVTFAQDSVNLLGTGIFRGSNAGLTVGAVTGSPNVKATIGSYTLKCPMECAAVKTSTNTPASTFTFAISSTTRDQ